MPTKPDFVFVCDPGHAWLIVTQADLDAVGLGPADFSPASTRAADGRIALEEDVDAPTFIRAWERHHGRRMNVADHYQDHDAACRAWPSWGSADDATLLEHWSANRQREAARDTDLAAE